MEQERKVPKWVVVKQDGVASSKIGQWDLGGRSSSSSSQQT